MKSLLIQMNTRAFLGAVVVAASAAIAPRLLAETKDKRPAPDTGVVAVEGRHRPRVRVVPQESEHKETAIANEAGIAVESTFGEAHVECTGDLDGDDFVGMRDLLSLLAEWGPCAAYAACRADIYEDGVIDDADVESLIENWGPCTEDEDAIGHQDSAARIPLEFITFMIADEIESAGPEEEQVFCTGDLNGDGLVNIEDMLAILASWGRCDGYGPCAADLDEDGIVDDFDLDVLLKNWGLCAYYEVDLGSEENNGLFAQVAHGAAGESEQFCIGDVDGDGYVDMRDLLELLAEWGPCTHLGGCPADLNEDGEVNRMDQRILLRSWIVCETR